MKRITEQFLDKIEAIFSLRHKNVLEIGCGEGVRSEKIAKRCGRLIGIDPSPENIIFARKKGIQNCLFKEGKAEKLNFPDKSFDVAIFTLSFHHIDESLRSQAIKEAVRVVKKEGRLIFLEPATNGSFFEAEIQFDACDGDERKEKLDAYHVMINHPQLKLVKELVDETIFQFDSNEDFINSMTPQKNLQAALSFLQKHNYVLNAHRRINIFKPIP